MEASGEGGSVGMTTIIDLKEALDVARKAEDVAWKAWENKRGAARLKAWRAAWDARQVVRRAERDLAAARAYGGDA